MKWLILVTLFAASSAALVNTNHDKLATRRDTENITSSTTPTPTTIDNVETSPTDVTVITNNCMEVRGKLPWYLCLIGGFLKGGLCFILGNSPICYITAVSGLIQCLMDKCGLKSRDTMGINEALKEPTDEDIEGLLQQLGTTAQNAEEMDNHPGDVMKRRNERVHLMWEALDKTEDYLNEYSKADDQPSSKELMKQASLAYISNMLKFARAQRNINHGSKD